MWKDFQKAKIVCTAGPSTSTKSSLIHLVRAGADVIRINGAHGTISEHQDRIRLARKVSAQLKRPLAILLDLPGPKLRLGQLSVDCLQLRARQRVTFFRGERSDEIERIPIPSAAVFKAVKPRQDIFINDGVVRVRVLDVEKNLFRGRVVTGGEIRSAKGINLPDTDLRLPAITKRDQELLKVFAKGDVDYFGLSFVRTASSIKTLRRRMQTLKSNAQIVAKIETRAALDDLTNIVKAADAVMVARGDLGIEIPYAKVPAVTQRIVAECRQWGRPVITATQMLLSMVEASRPTRAEASDVASAVWNGTDALMLSEETSIGRFPTEAVRAMASIIREAERSNVSHRRDDDGEARAQRGGTAMAMSQAAVDLAHELGASAIVVPTRSGRSPRLISNARPPSPILALTSDPVVEQQMCLCWGVYAMRMDAYDTLDELLQQAERAVRKSKLLKQGDKIIVASGVHGSPQDVLRLLEVRTIA